MASQLSDAAGRKTILKSLPYMCVLCKGWFAKARALQRHMGSAHGLVEDDESDEGENDVDTYFSHVAETPESGAQISSSNNHQGDSSLDVSSTEGSNQILCNSYIDNILDVPINDRGNQIVPIGQRDNSLNIRTVGRSNQVCRSGQINNRLTLRTTMDSNHIAHDSYSNNKSGADVALQEATRIIGRIFNEHDYRGNQSPPCVDQLTPDQLDKIVSIERTTPQRQPSSTEGDISGTANTLARLISRLNERCSTGGVKESNGLSRDRVQDVGYGAGAGAGAELPGVFDGWGCGENAAAAALVEIGMRGNGHDYLAHGAELGDGKGENKRKNQAESSQRKKKKKVIKKATSEKNKMTSGKKKKVIKKKLNATSKSSPGKKKKKVISKLKVVMSKPPCKKLVTKKKKKINQPACKKGVDKVKKKVNTSKEKTSKLASKLKKDVKKPAPTKVVNKAKKATNKASPVKVVRRRKICLPIVFPCMFCGNTYDNDKELQIHRSAECGKNNHRCNKCAPLTRKRYGKELDDIARSVEKVRDVTDSTDYKYVAGKRLLVHYYQCFVCNQGYANHLHYCRHLNTHHTVRCQFCYLVYSSVIGLGKHMRCHERGPLKCCTCKKTYFSSAMLLAHMKGHTSDFSCQLCDVTFEFKDNIVRHNRELHSGYPIPPKPANAEIKTPPTIATKDQEQVPHLEVAPKDAPLGNTFQCKFCNKIFRKEETLELHLLKFHIDQFKDPSSGKYICEICGVVKKNANILRKHLRSGHTDPKQECLQCGKSFSHRQALTVHIESVHEKKREFQCQYCGKAVASKASLVDHERLHTGEKPYKCDECGKCYRLISEYQAHKAKEHSDLRPFQCTECPKQFAFRDKLRKHQRTHRPQELCSCDECGKIFVRADLLKEHMVVHRWVFACEHCDRKFSSPDARSYHMLKIHKIDPYRIFQDVPRSPPPASDTQTSVPEQTSSDVSNGVPDSNDKSEDGRDSPSEMKTEVCPVEISDSESDMDCGAADSLNIDDTDLAATSILSGLCNGE